MLRTISLTAALAMLIAVPVNAAPFNAAALNVDNSSIVTKVRARLTGKQRLNRLLRTHFKSGNPITKSVREATGIPRVTIIDRRVGGGPFSCAFRNFRNARVLVCD